MYDVETKFKVNHICLLFAFIFSIMPIIAKRLQWCQVFFFHFQWSFIWCQCICKAWRFL